ncbi:MAG: hypothetical protein HN613_05290 [Gammaproteobacteria bacterium]|jgi:hypothetical protein|nr:hypothetical protein [Gammaproteobacteria bacterium]MBT7603864.1 hypothetical protein [Gammaproteobacteria bacterium]
MFFKKKKEKDKIKLYCAAENPGSYSAIFLSSYRQIDIDVEWVDPAEGSEYSALIGTNTLPSLIDGKFAICRIFPVLTYLNIIGSKPKIEPRKARILAKEKYYISLIEKVLWVINIDSEKEKLLFLLDQQLEKYKFIAGDELTLADIYLFGFTMISNNDLVKYKNIGVWLKKMFSLVPNQNTESMIDGEFYKLLKERKIA